MIQCKTYHIPIGQIHIGEKYYVKLDWFQNGSTKKEISVVGNLKSVSYDKEINILFDIELTNGLPLSLDRGIQILIDGRPGINIKGNNLDEPYSITNIYKDPKHTELALCKSTSRMKTLYHDEEFMKKFKKEYGFSFRDLYRYVLSAKKGKPVEFARIIPFPKIEKEANLEKRVAA
jgi:hypothetical protein